MARTGRPFLNASRKRVVIIGDEDKTISTVTGDSTQTSVKSGETYIITSAASAPRTITLPPPTTLSSFVGQTFKIIWGVSSNAHETVIAVDGGTATLLGFLQWTDSGTGRATNAMYLACTFGVSITVHNNIEPGSWIEFLSNGTYWYIANSNIIANATPEITTL